MHMYIGLRERERNELHSNASKGSSRLLRAWQGSGAKGTKNSFYAYANGCVRTRLVVAAVATE